MNLYDLYNLYKWISLALRIFDFGHQLTISRFEYRSLSLLLSAQVLTLFISVLTVRIDVRVFDRFVESVQCEPSLIQWVSFTYSDRHLLQNTSFIYWYKSIGRNVNVLLVSPASLPEFHSDGLLTVAPVGNYQSTASKLPEKDLMIE